MDRLQPTALPYILLLLFAFSALSLLLINTYLNRAILDLRALFVIEVGSLVIFSEVMVLYIYVLGKTVQYWVYEITRVGHQSIDGAALTADLLVIFLGLLLFLLSYFLFIRD